MALTAGFVWSCRGPQVWCLKAPNGKIRMLLEKLDGQRLPLSLDVSVHGAVQAVRVSGDNNDRAVDVVHQRIRHASKNDAGEPRAAMTR